MDLRETYRVQWLCQHQVKLSEVKVWYTSGPPARKRRCRFFDISPLNERAACAETSFAGSTIERAGCLRRNVFRR